MTDQKRLEEIKLMVKALDGDFTSQAFGYEMEGQSILDDWKWLINRVQELEERNAFLEKAHITNIKIAENAQAENKRYKQALKFYANKENWIGEIARQALEVKE